MGQRVTRSAPPMVYHVAGINNILADVASRPIKGLASHFHLMEQSPLCPETFLTFFNSAYPLPQKQPWHSVQPNSGLWSNMISTLCGQQLDLRQWMGKLAKSPGPTGLSMPNSVRLIPGCATSTKLSGKRTSLPLPPGFELESTGERSKLASSLWKRPYVTWRKPSFWLGTTTQGGPTREKNLTCPSGTS
jgi:hypothetical protein